MAVLIIKAPKKKFKFLFRKIILPSFRLLFKEFFEIAYFVLSISKKFFEHRSESETYNCYKNVVIFDMILQVLNGTLF